VERQASKGHVACYDLPPFARTEPTAPSGRCPLAPDLKVAGKTRSVTERNETGGI
jgi:hypothetical protein